MSAGSAVARGKAVPDEDAIEAEVADDQAVGRIHRRRNRGDHVRRPHRVVGERQVGIDKRREIGLSHHLVRRLAVLLRNAVPDENAVVLGVGDQQLPVADGYALRVAQALRARIGDRALPIRRIRAEVLLADHHVRRRLDAGGNRIPDQNPVVVRVGDRQDLAIRGHTCRSSHAGGADCGRQADRISAGVRSGGAIDAAVRIVGLAKDVGGLRGADWARTGIRRNRRRDCGDHAGNALVDHDAIILVGRVYPVAVDDKKRVVRVRKASHAVQQTLAGARNLRGEGRLADAGTGALAGPEICGGHTGSRAQQ